ncbi:family 16 glycosylhydrolase [Salegentibacter sp. F188]|uniref:Family 16 glycosylhydrolase n=1 Tax=Autumnicola patrickiae TaxID=3075591 RepID=A0ABU3E4A7_9FLAO|nr:family 16 glycosylhydrolase [Salegentibacter sp. F188]MDT0690830.1 family 16 glycosylhydrolase [Salegentibacter sp. F188]
MKKIYINISLLLSLLFVLNSCEEEDYDIGEITTPTNLTVETEVLGVTEEMPDGDGSGAVTFNASADNAITYKFIYGDGFEEVSYDGTTTHNFNENGVNDYTVTVIASGTGGVSSNLTTTVTVFSDFSDPETKQLLTGGSSKTWYVAAAQPAHLGVGPASGGAPDLFTPVYYAAAPFEKAGADVSSCLYEGELTFSLEGEEIIYNQNNMGSTFFNASYGADFGGSGAEDQCLEYDTSGPKAVSLSPATSGIPEDNSTGTVINIAGGGFMSYYFGASSYEVLSIDENTMHVRGVMGNDPSLAWYLKFTTSQGAEEPEEPEEFETEFEELTWSQEFDEPLDTELWNFETGNGENGWGNEEAQYYTEDNAEVVDGNLVITARAEEMNGFDYTSSRITTQDNFEFTYGRVEARAKLPEGAGTWPAIWLLGADIAEVGWPETGEIDIMEHVGNQQNTIHGTLHYPGRSAGNADGDSILVENVSSEFHTYTMEWSSERIVFLVDGVVYHTYQNNPDSPFNKDFFLILNVAMGGTFGGEIAEDFEESSMEIDYIRVYQ